MLYFVFVSALLQFLTGGEGQDIYHVLTHPIHQGHVTLPWFFVQENISLQNNHWLVEKTNRHHRTITYSYHSLRNFWSNTNIYAPKHT